VVYDIRI